MHFVAKCYFNEIKKIQIIIKSTYKQFKANIQRLQILFVANPRPKYNSSHLQIYKKYTGKVNRLNIHVYLNFFQYGEENP